MSDMLLGLGSFVGACVVLFLLLLNMRQPDSGGAQPNHGHGHH